MSYTPSAEEREIIRNIKEREKEINMIFQELDIKESDILDTDKKQKPIQEEKSYFDKFKTSSVTSIRERYDQSIPGFKWMQLPYCKRLIYEKMLFDIPASLFVTFGYGLWYRSKNNLPKLSFSFFLNKAPVILMGLWAFTLCESLLLEPYCDINSYHYSDKLSSKEIAKMAKKQFQED